MVKLILVSEIKVGDKVMIDDTYYKVTSFEKSNVGKHGKVKCRIEAVDEKGNEKVIIRVADSEIQVEE